MYCENSVLRKRLGYRLLAGGMSGIGMDITKWEDGGGDEFLIAMTTEFIYKFNSDAVAWDNISPQVLMDDCESVADWTAGTSVGLFDSSFEPPVGTKQMQILPTADRTDALLAYVNFAAVDLTSSISAVRTQDYNCVAFYARFEADHTAGDLQIVLSESANGAKTGVAGTNYTISATDVDSAAGASTRYEITTDLSNMNAVISIGIWGTLADTFHVLIDDIRVYKKFTGTSLDIWSYDTVYDTDGTSPNWDSATAILLSNGVDKPVCWDGSSNNFKDFFVDTDFTNFVTVDTVANHNGHCIFYDYNDGEQRGRNMKWTDLTDCFRNTPWTTGTSGEKFVTQMRGDLQRAVRNRASMFLYTGENILEQQYVGGVLIYKVTEIINDLGLLSNRAIYPYSDTHFFIGSDGRFYALSGSGGLKDIGQLLGNAYKNQVLFSAYQQTVVGYDKSKQRLFAFYPITDDTYGKSYFSFNFLNGGAIEEGRTAHEVRGFATYENEVAYTCDGTWASGHTCDEDGYGNLGCNLTSFKAGFNEDVFLSCCGNVFVLDNASGKDYTTNIQAIVQTRDITINQLSESQYFRPALLIFNATNKRLPAVANTLAVHYSCDEGDTWTAVADSPVTLQNDWTRHQVEMDDIKCQRIRFKFTDNSAGDFQLGDMLLEYNPSTTRD
jgi:hypothetical protein